MLIYLVLMAASRDTLPWGQMSFWGAQVIVNLFSAIPFIENHFDSIRGDYVIGDATLTAFPSTSSPYPWRCWGWWLHTSWRCTRLSSTPGGTVLEIKKDCSRERDSAFDGFRS